MMYMYCFNQFGEQPAAQRYVVHMDYMNTPFQLDSSSGELAVNRSLQMEGTQSKYDIVVVADGGNTEAWTVTTITIGELVTHNCAGNTALARCHMTHAIILQNTINHGIPSAT